MTNVIFCPFSPEHRLNIFSLFRHYGMPIEKIAHHFGLKPSVIQAIVRQEMRKAMGEV